jgi:hypothetical protein
MQTYYEEENKSSLLKRLRFVPHKEQNVDLWEDQYAKAVQQVVSYCVLQNHLVLLVTVRVSASTFPFYCNGKMYLSLFHFYSFLFHPHPCSQSALSFLV